MSADATTGRAARTQARLRTAAREAFAELGWQGTRVQDIVERAGVSHGTFYTYYDNKAAVLTDLVTETSTAFVDLASRPWEAQDVRDAVVRVIGGFLDIYAADAMTMRTWLQAAREEPAFGRLYRELRQRFIERITEQIALVVEASGRTDAPPPRSIASALAAMVEHFAYCWTVLGEPHERDDAVEALLLIWGGALNAVAGFEIVRQP